MSSDHEDVADSGTHPPQESSTSSNETLAHNDNDLDIPRAISIPHLSERKQTLVLCFDGTGDQFDADNSNIVEFFSTLKKDDRSQQMVYYQAGIGTWTSPQIATPMGAAVSKALDEAIAWNLDAHVMDGYEFLMQNYEAGDRICLFGFSRGAYTASCLAGMLNKVGLLPACNHQQVPFAYKMYTRTDDEGWRASNLFKKTFSTEVDIEFVGLWDTVNSVGLIPRRLPFTRSNTIIRTFRHALALDEHRAKFQPRRWRRWDGKGSKAMVNEQGHSDGDDPQIPLNVRPHKDKDKSKNKNKAKHKEKRFGAHLADTDVKEVWFAGCHCDVGGGSVPNGTAHNLARIPLRWMVRECFSMKTGVLFQREELKKLGLDPDSLYPTVKDRPDALAAGTIHIQGVPSNAEAKKLAKEISDRQNAIIDGTFDAADPFKNEGEHDLLDALSPIYDQLQQRRLWWLLEVIPQRIKEQNEVHMNRKDRYFWWVPNILPGWLTGRKKTEEVDLTKPRIEINFGKGRKVRGKDKAFFHRTVRTRMEAQYPNGKKYAPKARYKPENVEWVD